MDFIVITGMSGAGKSKAMEALEDLGYFCADNVPPQLLGKIVELGKNVKGHNKKMAVGLDTRSLNTFGEFSSELENLREEKIPFRMLFFDASDAVLLNRFKEHRRSHPLVQGEIQTIQQAIQKERDILSEIKASADYVLDTTQTSVKEMKTNVVEILSHEGDKGMVVQLMSFGFKYGMPLEPDMVFDVRFLPNPFYIPELKAKTGLDKEVSDYVMSFTESQQFKEKLYDLLDFLYPLYQKEGRVRLAIAIGCTGGKHRSVTFVEELAKYLEGQSISAVVVHRDLAK